MSSDTAGLLAILACALAFLALLWALFTTIRLRRLRAAQTAVLGDRGAEDLVAHAAGLQEAFLDLRDWVQSVADRLDERMETAERRLDGAISFHAIVRYDAYGELSGHQSASIALLDAERNGVVLSSIAHREHARMYCKQILHGEGELELSPEEAEAVRLALSGARGSRTLEG